VGDRNVGASRYASQGRRKWRSQYRPDIRDATPDGRATRENLARVANVEQRKTNEMIGAELGDRYVGSPGIWDEPGGPEHLFREYVPTTWPGARLPHVWLTDELVHRSPQRVSASEGGCSVHDVIGDGFTLLKLGESTASTDALEHAMVARRAPFGVLTIKSDAVRAVYG